jgi:hypothetical protein
LLSGRAVDLHHGYRRDPNGLRRRLEIVEAAIERVSSDPVRYGDLINDLEDLRSRLLAALREGET